jgi:hypothetical protein
MLLTYGCSKEKKKKERKKKKKRNSEGEKNDIKNNFHLLAIKGEFLPNNLLGILKNCKESHYRDDSRWILHLKDCPLD